MGHSVSDLVAISISGISKIFVGELIEEGACLLLLLQRLRFDWQRNKCVQSGGKLVRLGLSIFGRPIDD